MCNASGFMHSTLQWSTCDSTAIVDARWPGSYVYYMVILYALFVPYSQWVFIPSKKYLLMKKIVTIGLRRFA